MTQARLDPSPRTDGELVRAQVEAIDGWLTAHGPGRRAPDGSGLSREQRLDAARHAEALVREHAAIAARAELHLRQAGGPMAQSLPLRAVIAHRNAWLRQKVTDRLLEHGIDVVGSFDDGADAAGTVVVEQPDLLFVEDRLPTLTGLGVVARARALAPAMLVAVQIADSSAAALLVEAGAHAVFARRIPPADIVDRFVACLSAPEQRLVLA